MPFVVVVQQARASTYHFDCSVSMPGVVDWSFAGRESISSERAPSVPLANGHGALVRAGLAQPGNLRPRQCHYDARTPARRVSIPTCYSYCVWELLHRCIPSLRASCTHHLLLHNLQLAIFCVYPSVAAGSFSAPIRLEVSRSLAVQVLLCAMASTGAGWAQMRQQARALEQQVGELHCASSPVQR